MVNMITIATMTTIMIGITIVMMIMIGVKNVAIANQNMKNIFVNAIAYAKNVNLEKNIIVATN
jgi:hypothetical protein